MAAVLIIDDEPDVRTMIRNVLEEKGHEVDEAGDGQEGLTKCWTKAFDVVITDIKMPNGSGLSFVYKLKETAPNTRIITITGYHPSLLFQAQEIGADIAFTKPFSMTDIVDAIGVLSQARQV